MSTQKGNSQRSRSQKHKNSKAFKNDMHDTSHTTKKINSLEFFGLCDRCKSIIDWKVKYKKYKLLTTPKKCVKCLEKKVKDAYYIVCQDCCNNFKICSKCSKPCEELEFGESEIEKRKKESQFQQELKQLTERQRRKFLRLLEKGLLNKENLVENPEEYQKKTDSEFDEDEENFDDEEDDDDLDEEDEVDDDEDIDDDDDDDDDSNDQIEITESDLKKKLKLKENSNQSNVEQDDDDDDDYETIDEDDDDDDDEDEPHQNEKSKQLTKKSNSNIKIKSKLVKK